MISGLLLSTYVAIPGTISASKSSIPASECMSYWSKIFQGGTEDNYRVDDDHFYTRISNPGGEGPYPARSAQRASLKKATTCFFKQSGFVLKIRCLDALLPDARFILVLRNPIDNFASLMKVKQAIGGGFWGIKVPGWRTFEGDFAEQALYQMRSVLDIVD
jgi:hypothetical protein